MFRDTIKKLVDRLEGGVGGVLMGFDGITVESYVREGTHGVTDIQTIGLEFAHLIAQARRTAQALSIGLLRELVQILNKDYFVACAFLSAGAASDAANGAGEKMGRARYLMRITAPRIEAEL
jgi:predicted regulator of Ras-like GTPase activity (Roadblock/LC7/MglB family)